MLVVGKYIIEEEAVFMDPKLKFILEVTGKTSDGNFLHNRTVQLKIVFLILRPDAFIELIECCL